MGGRLEEKFFVPHIHSIVFLKAGVQADKFSQFHL